MVWSVSDSSYASVSNQSGVGMIKAIANGTIQARCSLSGGDASVDKGMGAGVVFGTVNIGISNGKTINGGTPSSKITFKIIYENDPDNVAVKKTFTKEEFAALGAITKTYTLTQGSGKYVTDTAYGVPIATILQLLKLDVNDIRYFTLRANDGANPGKISAKWLLKTTRYYLPNYDVGGSWQEKQQVPSMIAMSDSWTTNSQVTGEMNSGTCFRLVFGSATNNDAATAKSIKFINTITIVMAGSAPSTHGDSDKGSQQGTGGTGSGVGGGDGSGDGEGSDGTKANSNSSKSSAGGSTGDSESKSMVSVDDLDAQTRWSIYEMMNKSNSSVPVTYEENPLTPFALPAVLVIALLAAFWRYYAFRRRIA